MPNLTRIICLKKCNSDLTFSDSPKQFLSKVHNLYRNSSSKNYSKTRKSCIQLPWWTRQHYKKTRKYSLCVGLYRSQVQSAWCFILRGKVCFPRSASIFGTVLHNLKWVSSCKYDFGLGKSSSFWETRIARPRNTSVRTALVQYADRICRILSYLKLLRNLSCLGMFLVWNYVLVTFYWFFKII